MVSYASLLSLYGRTIVDAAHRVVICWWLPCAHGHRQGVGRAGVPAGGWHLAAPDPIRGDRTAPAGALDQDVVPDLRHRAGHGHEVAADLGRRGFDTSRSRSRLVRGARTIGSALALPFHRERRTLGS